MTTTNIVPLEPQVLADDDPSIGNVTLPDFDPFEVGKQVEQETTILELHIGNPGFKKALDTNHFIKVLGGLTEEQIAGLHDDAKRMIAQFRAGGFSETSSHKPDASMIHVSQDLIDKTAIKAIATCDKRFTNFIKKHALPSPIKFQGAYLMRLSEVQLVDEAVIKYVSTRKELLNRMEERWVKIIADAKVKRGPFFDSGDYPDFKIVRQKYAVEARWVNFNVPGALAKMNKEIYERESHKARLFFADAAVEARDAARVAFRGMFDHLVDQLGVDSEGKQKRFMGRSIEKIQEFIEMFIGGGDLTGDGQLQLIAQKAKDVLANVDPSAVRKEQTVRDSLSAAAKLIAEEASKLVVVSQRKFALADDDDDENQATSLSM